MVTEVPLQRAFLDDGLARVSWWNGRVLTAADLHDHQTATDRADRRLGRAIGAGVVDGLAVVVGADARSVDISAGLAVDHAGEVLSLPRSVHVPLVGSGSGAGSGSPAGDPAGFVACADAPRSFATVGHGVYLLTVASASGTQGAAAGADVRGVATRDCGPRYDVAGVQFRLVEVDLAGLAEDRQHEPGEVELLRELGQGPGGLLRNLVAAVLLDALPRRRALLDPFTPVASAPSVLTELHEQVLVDCEVPLAVLTWQHGAVGFVDTWSVRRPPLAGGGSGLARAVGSAGVDAGLVTLLQFHDHVTQVAATSRDVVSHDGVQEHFRYVPPAGLIPRAGGRIASRGPEGPTLLADRVWPLLRSSLVVPPLDLADDPGITSFGVLASRHARETLPYVVFATGGLLDVDADDRDVRPATVTVAEDLSELRDVTIEEGRSYTVWFEVTNEVTDAARYRFEPDVVVAGGAGTSRGAVIVDAQGVEHASVDLAPRGSEGATTRIGIRVDGVPDEHVEVALVGTPQDPTDPVHRAVRSHPIALDIGTSPRAVR